MQIQLWVCPNGHYYGASSVHGADLSKINNHPADIQHGRDFDPANPPVVSNRGTCQHCKMLSGGTVNIQRKLISIEVDLTDVFPENTAAA